MSPGLMRFTQYKAQRQHTRQPPGTTLKLKLLGPVLHLREKSQNVYTQLGSKTSRACSLSSAPGGRWTRRCQENQCLTPSSSPSGACWLLSWSRTRTLLQFLLNCCHRNLIFHHFPFSSKRREVDQRLLQSTEPKSAGSKLLVVNCGTGRARSPFHYRLIHNIFCLNPKRTEFIKISKQFILKLIFLCASPKWHQLF